MMEVNIYSIHWNASADRCEMLGLVTLHVCQHMEENKDEITGSEQLLFNILFLFRT